MRKVHFILTVSLILLIALFQSTTFATSTTLGTVYPTNGATRRHGTVTPQYKGLILQALRRGHPVMVCFTNTVLNRDHYVVAYKCIRAQYEKPGPIENFFYIYDPSKTRNYQSLDDYLVIPKDKYVLHHIREFYPKP